MTSIDPLGKTVLLVDNDLKARGALGQDLRWRGIIVHTASSLREARIHLSLGKYDLVLLAARENPEEAIAFRREILRKNPKQRVGFLVGPPQFITFRLDEHQTRKETKSSDWAEKLKGRLASA